MKVLVPALASVVPVASDASEVCGWCGRTDPDATGLECDGHTTACPECHDEHLTECRSCVDVATRDAAAELGLDDERWDW